MVDIASHQAQARSRMITSCTIARTGQSTVCRYLPAKSTLSLFSAAPADAISVYLFHFPVGTDVSGEAPIWDRVTVGGSIWAMYQMGDPRTYAFDVTCKAVQLYGPDPITGQPTVPVYLRANAFVDGTDADNGPKYSNRFVRIGGPAQPQAQNQPYGVVMPGDYLYDTPDATWTQDDHITIVSQIGQTILPDVLVFRAARVERPGGAIPLCIVQLTGGSTFGS